MIENGKVIHLDQLTTDIVEETLEWVKEKLMETHADIIKNCELHPKGKQGCARCNTSKLTKVIIGATLKKLTQLNDNNK